jgi:hypothetical protein
MQELLSTSARGVTASLISVPDKTSDAENAAAAAIRSEESMQMQYEDERRKMYLSEVHIQARAAKKPDSPAKSPSKSRGPTTPSAPRVEESHVTTELPPLDVDTAFKWLAVPRPLVLAERRNREYMWFVIAEKPDDPKSSTSTFVFQWREILQETTQLSPVPAGSIVISDIRSIADAPHDPTIFVLNLHKGAKILKGTGGRGVVAVKCASPGDQAKYRQSLQSLLTASAASSSSSSSSSVSLAAPPSPTRAQ